MTFLFSSTPYADNSGDAFVTASIAEPSSLIPLFASDSASAQVSRLIFNGLVKYDKDLNLTGDLAERWEVEEGGFLITFHLRKNVHWQDGQPFTSADVAFTFEKLKDPSTPTPYGGDFEKVESLETPDAYTVRVRYREPFSPGLSSWSMGILPKHLPLRSRAPVGTGPYILKKWVSGEYLELHANKDYFEGEPSIARTVYRVIPDEATAFLELQAENIDFLGLSPVQFKRQTDTPFFKSTYVKHSFPAFSYGYIGYNFENPFFSDRRVRKALGLAIHKKEIIDVVLLGRGKVATGPFLPGTSAFNPAVEPSPFDPVQARALLEEAGWRDTDHDGFLDKEGKRFSFTLLTNVGNNERKMACEIIQRRWRDVGIDVRIQVLEWSTLLKEFIDKRRFEAVLLGWQLSPDPDLYAIFHSRKTKPGEFNFVSYKNAEVDRLIEEGRQIFPEEDRAKVYHRLHEILSDEEPYTFLFVPEALFAIHKRFQGVEPGVAGIGHNFIRWHVHEDQKKYKV
ncbi:MAG: peptide-binding protein [Candidatus Omnitrophica bacterium]|nr:peptide-binding protein [Candidatus Omnitrophota bacterium]